MLDNVNKWELQILTIPITCEIIHHKHWWYNLKNFPDIREIIGNAVAKGKLVNIKISLLRKDACYSQRPIANLMRQLYIYIWKGKSCTLTCVQISLHYGMKKWRYIIIPTIVSVLKSFYGSQYRLSMPKIFKSSEFIFQLCRLDLSEY